MPTRERVQALIDLVEGGRYVEAIEAFYHEDASIQENLDPPRRGRNTPSTMKFVDHEGRAFTLDELAFQLWRGERIVEERFYYDPAQRARRTAPG